MLLTFNFHFALGHVVVIQQRPYTKRGSPTAIIYIGMHMFSKDKSITWDKENMKFVTAMVKVLPLNDILDLI